MAWQGGVVMETPADNVDVPRQQRLLNRWRLLIPLVHWTGTLLALAVGIASVVTLPICSFNKRGTGFTIFGLYCPTRWLYFPYPIRPR